MPRQGLTHLASYSDAPRPDGSRNIAMRQVDAPVDEDGTGKDVTGAGAGGSSEYWRSSPDGSRRSRCAPACHGARVEPSTLASSNISIESAADRRETTIASNSASCELNEPPAFLCLRWLRNG